MNRGGHTLSSTKRHSGGIICAGIVLLHASLLCWGCDNWDASTTQAEPDQVFDCEPSRINFGRITEIGEEATAQVKVSNLAGYGVSLTSVTTSCGCIRAEFDGSILIPAGGYVVIPLQLKNAQHTPAHYQQTMLIKGGANGQTESVKVPMDYVYAPEIELNVDTVHFGKSDPGQNHSFYVTDRWAEKLSLNVKQPGDQRLSVTLEPAGYTQDDEPAPVWRVDVAADKNAFPGRIDSEIELHTNHPDRPIVTVPVRGEITGQVKVTPSRLVLNSYRNGELFNRTIELTSDKTVEIMSIESVSDALETSWEAWKGGVRVHVSGVVQGRPDPIDGGLIYSQNLRIQMASPQRYEIEIPVSGVIAKAKMDE